VLERKFLFLTQLMHSNLLHDSIAESVRVINGHYGERGNVTSTIVSSGGEAFVFDSLFYPKDTRELLLSIKRLKLNVKALVNTHWHMNHTAGNQYFFETKRVISHHLCGDLMRADNPDWFNKDQKEEDRVKPAYPNETVAHGISLFIDDKLKIKFMHTPGHTPDSTRLDT
jgi:glyoxylase-like metal-dependent hydrolase (beta-lactamase superfamily II)